MPRLKGVFTRAWLNPKGSSNSYVATNLEEYGTEFILADCGRSVTLHGGTDRAMVRKLVKVRKALDCLIDDIEARL